MILHYTKLRGYKYRVAAPFTESLPELSTIRVTTPWFSLNDGRLVIQPGYQWDGASGPTIDTPCTIAASLVHDVLYQMIRSGRLPKSFRATADWILYRLMRRSVQSSTLWSELRALYFFVAVRLFGGRCVRPRKVEPSNLVYSV